MSGHNDINCEAYKGDNGFFDYFTSIFFPIIIATIFWCFYVGFLFVFSFRFFSFVCLNSL